jgi:hypothetical protein
MIILSTILSVQLLTANPQAKRAEKHEPSISEKAFYVGVGAALASASLVAKVGWWSSLLSPKTSNLGKECLLLSQECGLAASRALHQKAKEPHDSLSSWQLNKTLLSHIPAATAEQQELLQFLKKRWLAKSTGFYTSAINRVCPCFDVRVQINPETSHSYARNPWEEPTNEYNGRIARWKEELPHPNSFPLILTRPTDLTAYLPNCLHVPKEQTVETTCSHINAFTSKVIIDLTEKLTGRDQECWLAEWNAYRQQLAALLQEAQIDLNQVLCIQSVQQKGVGGIRLLPLNESSDQATEANHEFLLEWISSFGLTANRIELDRCPLPAELPPQVVAAPLTSASRSRDDFLAFLLDFESRWQSDHPQKSLMCRGTLAVLKGFIETLTQEMWDAIAKCETRSKIAQLAFIKIEEQLKSLELEKEETSFFELVSHIEQIHADLSSLLEIFSPFALEDFSPIYRDALKSLPPKLKPMTFCTLHCSGMTNFAGIFKAVERSIGAKPHILYGANTYFECINTAHMVAEAAPIEEATEEQWSQVDLILAQFNPVLKRIDLPPSEYKLEPIAATLEKALKARNGKPLTVAIDATIDYINSPRIMELLDRFQEEIEKGYLNVICYRSGLKFDLFGMDNYCGAPLYMIHNQESKWDIFDSTLQEAPLVTDRLSLNWFCLAYQSAAPELDLYRKQIFDNTRALLKRVPTRLLDGKAPYHIVPIHEEADAAFLDIKISGPLHRLRGPALAGGSLYLTCMEGGHPIFYRPSLGFYHPNFTMLFSKEKTTIRLTLGLDPAQVDLLADCFEKIDRLNGTEG